MAGACAAGAWALAACERTSGSRADGATVPTTSIDDLASRSDVVLIGSFRSFGSTPYTPPHEKQTTLVVATMAVTRSSPTGTSEATVVWGADGANALGDLDENATYLVFGTAVGAHERDVLTDRGDIFLPTAGKKGVFRVDGQVATQLAGGFDAPQGGSPVPASRRSPEQQVNTLFSLTLRKACTRAGNGPDCQD